MRYDDVVGILAGVGVERERDRDPEDRGRSVACAMNAGADTGAIPANVSEKIRPTVTAGLANDVELVNQYAAPMYAPTAGPR